MSAVYILWLRQLKRDMRSRFWIIAAVGQPAVLILALALGMGPVYRKASGASYLQFLAPGIIAMGIIFPAVLSGMEIVWDKQFGFLKESLVAPVSRFKIILGRILGGATVALMRGCVVLIFCLCIGFRIQNIALLPVTLLLMLALGIFCAAVGSAIGSTIDNVQSFQFIINLLISPFFFFSTALFPVEGLSWLMRLIVSLNPVSYGIDGLRGALTNSWAFTPALDALVLGVLSCCALALASWLFSRIQL